MTPREEFEYDLRRLCWAFMQHASLGLLTEIVNQVFKEVVDKWAPKDMLETDQKHDIYKECDGLGNDCKDKYSIHYWMCHMTQEEFEERTQDRQKTPVKLNKIEKPCNFCGTPDQLRIKMTPKDTLENPKKHDIPLLQAWGASDLMVTAAHRYCLGRRSYIVSECVDWLIKNWGLFHVETKKRIIEETQEAIERGLAGDACDIEQWQRLIQIERKHDD